MKFFQKPAKFLTLVFKEEESIEAIQELKLYTIFGKMIKSIFKIT